MAIARGAGTEIIRTIYADDIDSTDTILIFGVQHHIYTVLNVTFIAETWQASGNKVRLFVVGWDAKGGTSGQSFNLFNQAMIAGQTFVWNDKFSFNGHEPTGVSGAMDSIVKQDAIADQGSSTPQYLEVDTTHSSDSGHISVTYIDQNNA